MKLEITPLDPNDEFRLRSQFAGSAIQQLLHNELVRQVLVERDRLETCSAENLLSVQTSIRVRRELLGFLHRYDKIDTPYK